MPVVRVHIRIYLFVKNHIWTHRPPEKQALQLSVTRNLNVRFADKNCKLLLKMLTAHTYLFVWHSSFYF